MSKLEQLIDEAADLYDDGEYEAAVKKYLAAAKLDPKDWTIWMTVGDLYTHHLQEPDEGIPYYEKSLPLMDPEEENGRVANCYYAIGFAHFLKKDDKSAEKFYKKALKACDVHIATWMEYGKLEMRAKDFKKARAMFDEAHKYNTIFINTPEMLPEGLFGGPHVSAIISMDMARICFIHTDDEKAGLPHLKNLLEELQDDERVMKLAGEAIQAKKKDTAKKILKLLLKEFPEHEEATELLEELG